MNSPSAQITKLIADCDVQVTIDLIVDINGAPEAAYADSLSNNTEISLTNNYTRQGSGGIPVTSSNGTFTAPKAGV
jgi:hypothetical protein